MYWFDKGSNVNDGPQAKILDVRKGEYTKKWDEFTRNSDDSGQRKVWTNSYSMNDVYAQQVTGRTDLDKINQLVASKKADFVKNPSQWITKEWINTPSFNLGKQVPNKKIVEGTPAPKRDELTFDDSAKKGSLAGTKWKFAKSGERLVFDSGNAVSWYLNTPGFAYKKNYRVDGGNIYWKTYGYTPNGRFTDLRVDPDPRTQATLQEVKLGVLNGNQILGDAGDILLQKQ